MNLLWREHRERIERYLAEGRTVGGGDRAAQSAAKAAEKEATGTAGTARGNANAERSDLVPFYQREMTAQHQFNAPQLEQLLSSAEAPLAGSAATAAGQAASQGARTRNTSGFSAALDQNARDRQAQLGQAGLDINKQDILGAKQLNQAGAAGMQGLFGTDTSSMLNAMGQEHEDINSQVEAGKSGWFQNTMNAINTFKPGVNFSHNF